MVDATHCNPVRWEIHGYNTIIGSHFDYYVIDIDEFERDPEFDPATFYKPEGLECKRSSVSSSKWHLLLSKLAEQAKNPIRKQNVQMIEKHNDESFSMTANKFIDLSFEEFLSQHTGYKPVRG